MRPALRFAPLLATCAVAASSCNTLFPFYPDQACETQVHALCHFAYACCTATERDAFTATFGVNGFRNEGECVDELLRNGTAECGNSLAVQDAVQEKRFTYDATLAQQCLQPVIDALNQCASDKVFDAAALKLDPKCDGLGFAGGNGGNFAFGTGTVAAGKGCFQSFECSDAGSLCDVPVDTDPTDGKIVQTAAGKCKAPAKEGGDCSADTGTNGLCEPGTVCNAQGTCEKIVKKANGDLCVADGECDSDFCNDVGGVAQPRCADKLQIGDVCADDNDCVTGSCPANADQTTCQAPPKVVIDACNGIQADDTSF